MESNSCMKKYFAEMLGTLVLVLFGCGVAVYTGGNVVATSLAFGFSLIAMSFVVGNVSGCHVNPAVSLAMLIAKRIDFKDFIGYMIAQFIGAVEACFLLWLFFGRDNGYGANVVQAAITTHYSAGASLVVGMVAELVLTFVFVMSVLGVTSQTENKSVIGFVAGIALTLVHLLGISLTGTSVNPTRSLFPAFFAGGEALRQVWVYVAGPFVGAILAAICYGMTDHTAKHRIAEGMSA